MIQLHECMHRADEYAKSYAREASIRRRVLSGEDAHTELHDAHQLTLVRRKSLRDSIKTMGALA